MQAIQKSKDHGQVRYLNSDTILIDILMHYNALSSQMVTFAQLLMDETHEFNDILETLAIFRCEDFFLDSPSVCVIVNSSSGPQII